MLVSNSTIETVLFNHMSLRSVSIEYREQQRGPDRSTVDVDESGSAKVCNVIATKKRAELVIPLLEISIMEME